LLPSGHRHLLDIGLFEHHPARGQGKGFLPGSLARRRHKRFCRERNRAFRKKAEMLGCILKMAEAILEPCKNRTGPTITCVFDLLSYGAKIAPSDRGL
jgi:hypothetical protein